MKIEEWRNKKKRKKGIVQVVVADVVYNILLS